MRPTQRTYTDVETGARFRYYTSDTTGKSMLLHEDGGNHYEVNSVFICAHTPSEIKINNKKVVSLDSGEFYSLKEGEKVTHRKFIGFGKFVKI